MTLCMYDSIHLLELDAAIYMYVIAHSVSCSVATNASHVIVIVIFSPATSSGKNSQTPCWGHLQNWTTVIIVVAFSYESKH